LLGIPSTVQPVKSSVLRTISCNGTNQTLEAFRPLFAIQGDCDKMHRRNLYEQFLEAVAIHRVEDRPDRFEPRLCKRRPKKDDSMFDPGA
jgi:hypothetical protein